MGKLVVEKGTVYGYLTVIKEGSKHIIPSGQHLRTINCLCKCGVVKDILLSHLVRSRIDSCGCKKRTQKGLSTTKIYNAYRKIKERCDGKTKDSDRYLGRGISVCDEWKNDFLSFYDWSILNGWKDGLQIDRKDNNKGYSPENCRWVTSIINANNKENTFKVTYYGVEYPFKILIRKLKKELNQDTIRARIKHGWTIELAFDTLIRKGNYKTKKR